MRVLQGCKDQRVGEEARELAVPEGNVSAARVERIDDLHRFVERNFARKERV